MQHVIASEFPLQSALRDRIKPMDFIDCYSVESDLSPRHAAEIITNFPGWAQCLVAIRNIITAPFGLLKEGPDASDKVGFFPVESENSEELIAGFNDKHLDFRVSVMSQDGRVFLSTWVHTNNPAGKLYLRVILPFHLLIARNALARVKATSKMKQG
jgi:hypothetical protein